MCTYIINQISGCFDLALCFSCKNNLELHLSGDLSRLSSARSTRLGHWLLEGHVLQMLRWQLKSQGQAPEARAESRGHERPIKRIPISRDFWTQSRVPPAKRHSVLLLCSKIEWESPISTNQQGPDFVRPLENRT